MLSSDAAVRGEREVGWPGGSSRGREGRTMSACKSDTLGPLEF